MTTLEQIKDFATFARDQPSNGQDRSMDDLYDQWRRRAFEEIDALAVQASLTDLQNGERGQPLDEFLAEFNAQRNLDAGE